MARVNAAKLLPNVRKLFIPDPGYVILDADLKGADAQVVAWEADDNDLKQAFRDDIDLHVKNATDMWGERFTSLEKDGFEYKRFRQMCKHTVHLFNYVGSARTAAITQGWTIKQAEEFEHRWFTRHPGIRRWHDRVRIQLETTRRVTNKFGFHKIFFDRIDTILPEAIAWIPQSTVATTTFKGALRVREHLSWVEFLLQVHDSLVMQIPRARLADILLLRETLAVVIPYPDPLTIPWGISVSEKSWGDVEKMSWEDAATLKF